MTRQLTFEEALMEDQKNTPPQTQQPVGQQATGQPQKKPIKDPTKANESNKQIARIAAGHNSDTPSPVNLANDPKRFYRGSEETPRTPEEQAAIDAHDKEVEEEYSADSIYGQGNDNRQDAGYSQYGNYGYGNYGYSMGDVRSLDDVVNTLEPYHVPNAKDLKREKRNMMIRAIGDGISAIAGMVGSAKGGPNTVEASNSLTKSGMDLQDKLREQRRKDYTAYLNAALKREQASAATLRARTNLERSREISRREAMKAEHEIKMAEQKMKLAQDKQAADQAYHDALVAIQNEKNRILDEYYKGKLSIEEKNAAIRQLDANTRRLNANRSGGGSGGGGGRGGRGGSSGGGSSKDYETQSWSTYDPVLGEVKHSKKIYGGGGGSSKPGSASNPKKGSKTREFLRGQK